MKLIDLKLSEYLDILYSNMPAPGGGSVSALAGAQGTALIAMVADLTLDKEQYSGSHDICKKAKEKASKLYLEFADAVDKDTEAFNLVANAFKMPRTTDRDKEERKETIAKATMEATKVPFHVMKLAEEGLETAETMVGNSNSNCASDLGVGIQNLLTAVKGAWLNVKINLPRLKDDEFRKTCEEEGVEIVKNCAILAEKLYKKIAEDL